jgi:hypothetical protein
MGFGKGHDDAWAWRAQAAGASQDPDFDHEVRLLFGRNGFFAIFRSIRAGPVRVHGLSSFGDGMRAPHTLLHLRYNRKPA